MSNWRIKLDFADQVIPVIWLEMKCLASTTEPDKLFPGFKDKPTGPLVPLQFWLFGSFQLDEGTPPEPEGSFVDYQTSMVKYSKAIAVTAQEMVSQFILLHARYFVMDCHGNKRWEGAMAVFGREFDESEQRFDSSVEFTELTTQDS